MKRKYFLWILIPLFFFLIVLPGAAVFLLYKNQKQLTQKGLAALNEKIPGELIIKDSYISPFKNFPYISIDLHQAKLFGEKGNYQDTILSVKDLYVGFDVMEIISGNYTVKSVKLSSGKIHLLTDSEGKLNLMKAIEMEKEVEKDEVGLDLSLSSISLEDVLVTHQEPTSSSSLSMKIAKSQAAIKLQQDHVFVDLDGALVLDLYQDGEPSFFNEKNIGLGLALDYNQATGTVNLKKSQLQLEEARFSLSGSAIIKDDIDLDLKLGGEKPDFSLIAAFLPNETAEGLKRYKNQGEVFFNGRVRGKAGNGQVPEIAVEFGCENAYFLNPNSDKKVDDLRFTGYFTNGKDRNLKTSEFQLLNFNARPEEGIFQGRLVIRDFENPYVKINLNADLDLGFLGQFFEIEGLQGISGQVMLNMDFDELIDIESGIGTVGDMQNTLQSELIVKNLNFSLPELPYPVRQMNAYAFMKEGNLRLDRLDFKILDSDFSMKGSFDDFPALIHGEDLPVKANMSAKATKIDLGQLLPEDSSMTEVITDFRVKLAFESRGNQLQNFEYLPKGEFFVEDFYAKLKHFPHELHDFDVDILIGEKKLEIKEFTGMIDTSDFRFTGKIDNYPKWFEQVTVGSSNIYFDFESENLVVNDLLTYQGVNYLPEDYREEQLQQVKAKGKVNLLYDGDFQSADLVLEQLQGRMKIHPLKLEDFQGRVHFEENFVQVDDFKGKMGISDFKVNLGYNLSDSLVSKKNYFSIISERLDLDALLGFESIDKEVKHEEAFNIFELPFSDMDFSARIDKMNYHTFWLDDVVFEGRTTPNHYLYVDTLGLRAADGRLGVKGYFNGSDPDKIYFNSTMKAEKLDLDKLMIKFDNFGQDQMINENLHGLVSGTIKSNFLVYPDLTPIIEKSEAQMDLIVYQGRLVKFAPLQAMGDYFKDRNLNNVRFDTLKNTFELKEGILNIPRMNINSSLGFIEISGKQSLDLNMDYFIRVPLGLVTQVGFRSLFGGKSREEIDPEQEDEIIRRDPNSRVRFLNISMSGTPDNYKIGLGRDKNK
ncbi:AsmA-like C-terminal region-containing protein [Arthrospiribacter ruber]|uniref:Membrane biogenesis protein n=1 Tax=Arthrospiribacter ruber TaxID=2487934 RepID=A0A951IZ73_9BACT|nr:AsmA-like C-terminal region-containing protein [Arthrospiribacter ruber]MBW3468233.1 membrane biogenesis protein [Arthrospiribacter ruber]